MKKFLCSLMTIGLLIVGLGVMPVHAEEGVATIDGVSYNSLKEAVAAVPELEETEIVLSKNITMSTNDIVTIGEDYEIILNLNGKTINVDNNFSGRMIINYGSLTVMGNGIMDTSASLIGYGPIDNYGTLVVKNGTYKNNEHANATCIWNRSYGVATFENGNYYGATAIATQPNSTTVIKNGKYESPWYPAVDASGKITIDGGEIINTSCSSCDSEHWGYALRSRSDLTFNNGTVYGVQGALGIAGGKAVIKNGHFETRACKNHPSGSTSFYALYVAGENSATDVTVDGGTFISAYRTTVLIGNDNTGGDGGSMQGAKCIINNGNFTTRGATNVPVVTRSLNTGNSMIYGGTYCKAVDETLLANGYTQIQNADGTFTVQKQ